MDKYFVLISRREDVLDRVLRLIRKESKYLLGVNIHTLNRDKLQTLLKQLKRDVPTIIIINTACSDPSTVDEKMLEGLAYIINFCIDKANSDVRVKIYPYVLLLDVILARVKVLTERIDKINIYLSIPRSDLQLIADLHGLQSDQLIDVLLRNVKRYSDSCFFEPSIDIMEISISITGKFRGRDETRSMRLNLSFASDNLVMDSYTWQLASLLDTINYAGLSIVNENLPVKIGSDEGLYAVFMSKLIAYGGCYTIEIN